MKHGKHQELMTFYFVHFESLNAEGEIRYWMEQVIILNVR